MRKSVALMACALLLIGSAVLPALSLADFDKVVDFSVTLKTLAAVAEGEADLPQGKMLVLSGTVSDVNIISKDQANFKVRIEVITGEWIGTEDVKSYACYVDFTGAQFFKVFPARAPQTSTSEVLTLNSRVLLVGRALSVTTTPLGE